MTQTNLNSAQQACQKNTEELMELFTQCAPLMTAVGNETRQAIILALLNAGPEGIRVGDLTQHTNLSRPAISHHLKVLKDVGIVAVRKEKTMNFYYLNPEPEKWDTFCTLAFAIASATRQAKAMGFKNYQTATTSNSSNSA